MRNAVIVSTARTPIGRAYKGAFNATPAPTLAAHAIRAAVARAGIDPASIDDCIIGTAMPQGDQHTIGRTSALRAGLPVSVSGMTIDYARREDETISFDGLVMCLKAGAEHFELDRFVFFFGW